MLLNGSCHCGNIAFTVDWPDDQPDIPARACGCSFCIKHGGVWTSNPKATLAVTLHRPAQVSRYAFGTQTATFHVCTRCGAVPFVTSEINHHLYAVVNVNTLENVEASRLLRAAANFEGEEVQARLARRAKYWIRDVRISGGDA